MLLLTNLCFLGVPVFLARAVQALKDGHPEDVPSDVLLLVVFAIVTALTRIGSRVWIFNAARAAEYDLRSDLFGHLMTLSPGVLPRPPDRRRDVAAHQRRPDRARDVGRRARPPRERGDVVRDRADVHDRASIRMVALLAIIPYPLIFFVGQALSKRIYRTMREVQAELGALSSRIQEDLGAIQVIKTYGLEDVRRTGFVASSKRLLDKNMDAAKVRIQLGPIAQHARVDRRSRS